MRFFVNLIHDLDTQAVHGTTQMLDDMKVIKDNFGMWKKLFSDVIVGTKDVHGNDFDSVSDLLGARLGQS
ncbi:Uncharacterised protein [Streptococcus pyogenes]|nr:Uncharacterised protein [Streptococcus pyogenes]